MQRTRRRGLGPLPQIKVGSLNGVPRILFSPRLVLLGSFVITSVVNYALGLGMGWLLLPGDFGHLAFVQTILLIVGLVLQAGVPWVLAREIVNAEELRRPALVRGALAVNGLVALAFGIVVLALFAIGPLSSGLESSMVAWFVALSFLPVAVIAVGRGTAQGADRFSLMAALQVAEVVGKALAAVALVLLGFGVEGAVGGYLLGSLAAGALAAFFLVRPLRVELRGWLAWPEVGKAVPMFAAMLGLMLILNLGLLAVKVLYGADREAAGYFQAGLVLANAPYYLVTSAIVPVLFTRLARHDSVAETVSEVGSALRLTLALVIPIELALAAFPSQALDLLFPSHYEPAASVLRLLALGNGVLIVTAVMAAAFQAVGRPGTPALVLLVSAAAQGLALAVVVPTGGAEGAAAVLIVAAGLAGVWLGGVYLSRLGWKGTMPAVRWIARYALAIVLAGVVVGVVRASSQNVILAGICAAVVYGGAMLPLRLVNLPVSRQP